jgi:hypothetical protein
VISTAVKLVMTNTKPSWEKSTLGWMAAC